MTVSNLPAEGSELVKLIMKPERAEKLIKAATGRTKYIRLILQDVNNPHNIAACMRSAEAFGVQNVDIIDQNKIKPNSAAARGVTNWLTINYWPSIEECAVSLKNQGYRIAAGFPPEKADLNIETMPITDPIAVVFGNEHSGISPKWHAYVDFKFTIPMSGMVESLNISVSAAIAVQLLTHKARTSIGDERYLISAMEREALLNVWARNSIGI